MKEKFVDLLKALMIEEFGYEPDKAEMLIKKHHNMVVQGIMNNSLRATIMAIEIKEGEEPDKDDYWDSDGPDMMEEGDK